MGSGGVGTIETCNMPGQCHSSSAIPNTPIDSMVVHGDGGNGGHYKPVSTSSDVIFDNNFSGGVGTVISPQHGDQTPHPQYEPVNNGQGGTIFNNNFSGGVGTVETCTMPGQCHSNSAIPNGGQNGDQTSRPQHKPVNNGQGIFNNNFSGGVGTVETCTMPGQCHSNSAIPNGGQHGDQTSRPQ